MENFDTYSCLCRKIKPSEALKVRVLNSCQRSSRGGLGRHEAVSSHYKFKIVLAAVLVLAFLAAACTLAVSTGLVERLAQQGLADTDTLRDLSTNSSESAEPGSARETCCLALAIDNWAEYRVLEAICDYNSLYIHFQICPLDSSTMFLDQTIDPDGPVSQLGLDISDGNTVAEYADARGKKLRYTSIYLCYAGERIFDLGQTFEVAPDGSLHIYGSCRNPSSDTIFSLTCTAFTYPIQQQDAGLAEGKTEFTFTVQNKSSQTSMVFTQFSAQIQEECGISIESLVIEETELGYYCTFTYKGEKAESTLFSMVDEKGEFFIEIGPRGSGSSTANSDGTYCLTVGAPKHEHPEKMMFMLIDENHDKHGPFGFAP